LCVTAAGCGTEPAWTPLPPGRPAPDFTLPGLDGEPVRLSDYHGRVVVMEFWATWCGPCRFSTPSLDLVYRRYRDRGVTVLLINEGESDQAIRTWAGKRFAAPILLDRDQRVGRRYGVTGIPRLLVIDQHGQIAHEHDGYGGGLERQLSAFLDQLLEEPASPRDA
jgi:peroxiredoxin